MNSRKAEQANERKCKAFDVGDVAERFLTSYNKLLSETLELDIDVRVGGNQS